MLHVLEIHEESIAVKRKDTHWKELQYAHDEDSSTTIGDGQFPLPDDCVGYSL